MTRLAALDSGADLATVESVLAAAEARTGASPRPLKLSVANVRSPSPWDAADAPAAPPYAALMRPSPLAPPEVGLRPSCCVDASGTTVVGSNKSPDKWTPLHAHVLPPAAAPAAAPEQRGSARIRSARIRAGSSPARKLKRAPRTFANPTKTSPEKEAPDTVKQPKVWLSPAPGTAPVESYSPPASRPPRPLFSPSKAVRFKE